MDEQRRKHYSNVYRNALLDDVLPFWKQFGFDDRHGGIFTSLDRDGALLDSDKAVWPQGRAGWMFARIANTLRREAPQNDRRRGDSQIAGDSGNLTPRSPEPNELLTLASSCAQFLLDHCYDPQDGRLNFLMTEEGRPIRKRRYAFSESFSSIAFGELSLADTTGDWSALARRDFLRFVQHHQEPGQFAQKFTNTRPMRGIGFPMIAMHTAQMLRESIGLEEANRWIAGWIGEIVEFHVHDDIECVMESVTVDGKRSNHFDGRTLNPGHAIEAAWFVMWEGAYQENREWVDLGCRMLDWMWQRGWDSEFGGLLYFVDIENRPVQEYWHDMKFWWPHNEAIIATLMAYLLTGQEKYATWHQKVHDWSFEHFPDREHGEWYGYLHRDGRVSVPLKGNHWKGPFHLPRMLLFCWQMLEHGAWAFIRFPK